MPPDGKKSPDPPIADQDFCVLCVYLQARTSAERRSGGDVVAEDEQMERVALFG